MRYLSVCSGIESASVAWEPLGWKPAAFAEIDKFPSAVLAHHYPDVPNLGDFTEIKSSDVGEIDLLVGGTPCQSWSVAGNGDGVKDDRGKLTFEFLRLAARLAPKWIVWENVPGIVSNDGGAPFRMFLDELTAMGYVLDVDILDAQCFGLAQRRRRVFVVCQHRNHILNQKTQSSALILGQCLQEILALSLGDHLDLSKDALTAWGCDSSNARHGLTQRMSLFELHETCRRQQLQSILEEVGSLSQQGVSTSDFKGGSVTSTVDASSPTEGTKQATTMNMGTGCLLTEQSWRIIWGVSLELANASTTSTETSEITESKIYTFAIASLAIAKHIVQLNPSCPSYWSAVQSSLIAMKAFTRYARQAANDLFTDVEWLSNWRDFLPQAQAVCDALGDIGIESFGELHPIGESMCGHSPPRRETGQDVAGTTASRTSAGGGLGTDFEIGGGLVAAQCNGTNVNPVGTLRAGNGNETGGIPFVTLHGSDIARTLSARHDSSPCTDRGQNVVAFSCKDSGQDAGKLSPTLRSMNNSKSHANGGGQVAIAGQSVRRLTPRECERLQGFPDDYTLVPYRGKLAKDGPRYKAIGNSMAVNVMRWIGERIKRTID